MAGVTMEWMIEAVARQKMSKGQSMQPPCTEEEIERLRVEVPARLGAPVPQRYIDLLRISNGMATQGPTIYGSRQELIIPGLIEENEGMRLDRPDYVRLI